MVHTRLATLQDLDSMVQLLAELFEQEAEFRPSAADNRGGLTKLLQNPNSGRLLVAEREGDVIGMVNLLYTVSTALGGRVAILEDMIVSEVARGTGSGRALMQAALRQCRADRIMRVTLLTDADNHRGHDFYSAAGFQRSSMVAFRKSLVRD